MSTPDYNRTRRACYFSYLASSSVFVLPSMLFMTFHNMYGISYTLLGTLVLVNFVTQMTIDLIFTFFSKYFNTKWTVRLMPIITSIGMFTYAVLPNVLPSRYAYVGLVAGTVIFSLAAGLAEVLLSPTIAAVPSDNPEKDMALLHSLYGWGVFAAIAVSTVFFYIFGTENWMYLVCALAVLPLIASFLFCISPMPPMKTETPVRSDSKKGMGMALCVLCIFLGSAAENTMTNWISSFMESALDIPKTVGDIVGLAGFALLLTLTRIVYAKFTPDISKVLLWGMLGAAGCYIITGLSSNVVVSFAAAVLVGIFTSMLWPGTLILMEENVPGVGVAAYALMAASGDMGASVAPQLLGAVVDKVAVSDFALRLSENIGATPEEIGLKVGMLIIAAFPILGVGVVLYARKFFSTKKV